MWYLAVILFKNTHSPSSNDQLWEERFVLFEATNHAEAENKATSYSRSEEQSYPNQNGETVSWNFDSVWEVRPLDASHFEDKLEIFSRFLKSNEVDSLKRKFE
jgi:hypothetical protein